MEENYVPSEYAVGFLKEIKKGYQVMEESCLSFEIEHESFCRCLKLDMCAFDIDVNPDYPSEKIFQLGELSESDRQMLCEYLGNREKMYLLEQCVRNIEDNDLRQIAHAYYIERKGQPDIATDIGHTKSYVSKKLKKAEKTMPETIDRYWDWKYDIPGGRDCAWAGEWEYGYMKRKDMQHGILRFPVLPELPWANTLRRMGF